MQVDSLSNPTVSTAGHGRFCRSVLSAACWLNIGLLAHQEKRY